MENWITGAIVFLAIFCGQPGALAALCLYLIFALLVLGAVDTLLQPARTPAARRHRDGAHRPHI